MTYLSLVPLFTLVSLVLASPIDSTTKPSGQCTLAKRLAGAKAARASTTYGTKKLVDAVPFAPHVEVLLYLNGKVTTDAHLTAEQRRQQIISNTHNPQGIIWESDYYPVSETSAIALSGIRIQSAGDYSHKVLAWYFDHNCEIYKIVVFTTDPMKVNGVINTSGASSSQSSSSSGSAGGD